MDRVNHKVTEPEKRIEHIADIVGEWGNWQRIIFCFVFCLWIITALNNMGYSFYAYDVEYWCSDVPIDYPNKTEHMKCFKFLKPNESCTEWQYSREQMSRTIISQFNLVCERSNLASLSQSCYMWGYLISGLIFGYLSDKYGRRLTLWLSICVEIFALSYSALSPDIIHYLMSRLLIGFGSCGRTCAMRTLLVECCGPKYRSDIITGTSIGWIVGYVSLPLLAYLTHDYRLMHWFSIFLFILILIWFYFLWESPRWLITNGHTDRAKEALRYAIKLNKKSLDNFDHQFNMLTVHLQREQKQEEESKSKLKVNLFDLIRTPKLRRYTLIFNYISMVIALVYYGFSLNMTDFGGSFYLTFMLSGLVELPSLIATLICVRYFGRRKSYLGSLFLITLASLAVIPFSTNSWLSVTFALIGKSAVTFAWCVLDIYAPEIFPTILRNSALALLLMIGRIGSSMAPFMKNLAADYSLSAVMIFYALISCLAAFLVLFLPETKNKEIPDSVEQAESVGKKHSVNETN